MIQKFQGDVAFIQSEVPQQIKWELLKQEGYVAAYGEVSGHRHLITPERTANVEIGFTEDGRVFMRVNDGIAKVTHEEHGRIDFEPATYQIVKQREYSEELSEKWRTVMD